MHNLKAGCILSRPLSPRNENRLCSLLQWTHFYSGVKLGNVNEIVEASRRQQDDLNLGLLVLLLFVCLSSLIARHMMHPTVLCVRTMDFICKYMHNVHTE